MFAVGDAAPEPLPLRSEADVVASWRGDEPLVSILCTTHQHVDHIEDAISGFLGQRTDFPFEIIIRDDASTDGTAEIVRDFAARYPSIIRPVLEEVNRWPATSPLQVIHRMAKGDLFAICEGDDYWADPLKLARQAALLGEDRAAIASHHDAVVVENGRVILSNELPETRRRDLSMEELRLTPYLPFRTLMIRRSALEFLDEVSRRAWFVFHVDKLVTNHLGTLGHSRFLPGEGLAVYRKHPGGLESGRDKTTRKGRSGMSSFWVAVHLKELGFAADSQQHLIRAAEKFAGSGLVDKRDPELWVGLMLIRAFLAKRLGRLRSRVGRLLRG
jgi:glycosyltransferase involved in cell wall biosynthesis